MREPRAPLGLVDTQPLESLLQVDGEACRPLVLVVEDEHADGTGLAIATDGERGMLGGPSGGSQRLHDLRELRNRAMAEEGERDVQVVRGKDAHVGRIREGLPLPGREALDCLAGQLEGAEESNALIALDGTSGIHTGSSGVCDKRRRARWSPATAARRLIDARSPG